MHTFKNIQFKNWHFSVVLVIVSAFLFASCDDNSASGELGNMPNAEFSIVQGEDPNEVVVINQTDVSTIPYWSTSNGLTAKGDTAVFNFTFQGTYTITLAAAGQGGIDSTSQETTIAQNDPDACQGTVRGFIAGCTGKTWKLNPAAYAEMVGPGPGDGSYFGNSAESVSGLRACDFNDEWTFLFGLEGEMIYDNKGDFYEDNFMGNANSECGANSELSATQAPWASGNFNYEIIPNAGVNPEYGRLRVSGLGAHIGFAFAINGSENRTAPVESITYDIIGMEQQDGYDLLTLTIDVSGNGSLWWTFTLRSDDS